MISHLFKSRRFLGFLSLTTGTVLSQVISFGVTTVISRIYSPADIGQLSVFISIVGILAPLVTLRYELALPIAEEREASILVSASIISAFLLSPSASCIFYLYSRSAVTSILLLLALVMYALDFVYINLGLRNGKYRRIAISKVFQKSVGGAIQIGAGFLKAGVIGLIVGGIVSNSLGWVLLYERLRVFPIKCKEVIATAKKYIKFPAIMMPSTLLNATGLLLPNILVNAVFGADATGFFNIAFRVINLPVALVGSSMGQVFYAEGAKILKKQGTDSLRKFTVKIFWGGIALGIAIAFPVFIWGPQLFTFVFGSKWWISGQIARILSVMLIIRMGVNPVSPVPVLLGKQEIQLYLDILRAAMVIGSFLISKALNLSLIKSVWIFSISMAIVYLITIAVIFKILKLAEQH